jgi:mono/diheme cytochrome c family protein
VRVETAREETTMKRLLPMLLVFALGCPSDDGDTDPTETTRVDDILALTGDTAAGMSIYSTSCGSCHQADGSGGAAFPDLTAYVPTASEEEVLIAIMEGGAGMAPYEDTFDDQQLADVLAYVISEFGS